jgi:2-keto-3-deoxy-L-rhamnonate aldolase RhmA
MAAAQDAVAAAAAKNNLAWGHPAGTSEQIAAMAKKGARLIACGSDFGAIYSGLPNFAQTLEEGLK